MEFSDRSERGGGAQSTDTRYALRMASAAHALSDMMTVPSREMNGDVKQEHEEVKGGVAR